MQANLLFGLSGKVSTIHDIFNNTTNGVYITECGLLCTKTDGFLVIEKITNQEFVDINTGRRIEIKNGKFAFIDKPFGYIYKGCPDPNDVFSILKEIFVKYPKIDMVIAGKYFYPRPKSEQLPNLGFVGAQGTQYTGEIIFKGFDFIDVETDKLVGWRDGLPQLLEKVE